MAIGVMITGATGFAGSHVADACVERGWTVHAIARPSSDTKYLESIGATIHRGELTDPETLQKALAQADYAIHCAAKVGDWGPVEEYRAVNVEGLRKILDACVDRQIKRFVHVSSLGVYAARHHYGTDENEPPPVKHIDGYTQSKVESEHLALDYHRLHGLPVTVVRPGFIYGPRDRTVLPTIIGALTRGEVRYLGNSQSALNTTYVLNLVDVIFRALEKPEAVGRVYNVTDGEYVSKRKFFESIADGLGLPRPRRTVPLFIARIAAWVMEGLARRFKAKKAPRLTQARLKFLGLNLDFSIARARTELGYEPKHNFEAAMAQTLAWFRQQKSAGSGE